MAYYFLRTRKIVPSSKENVVVNPYEEAMKKLEQLRQVSAPAKTVHSKLTDIFRMYIFRKKGILSLQKTTDDLILQVKDVVNDKGKFDKLSQALRLSDFVKFAKYIPSENDKEDCFQSIKNTITNIEKSETKVLPSGKK